MPIADFTEIDADKIRRLAAKRGIPRGKIGPKAGLTCSTIYVALRDRRATAKVITALARLFKVPYRELLASATQSEVEESDEQATPETADSVGAT